jgi:hypothetical protein
LFGLIGPWRPRVRGREALPTFRLFWGWDLRGKAGRGLNALIVCNPIRIFVKIAGVEVVETIRLSNNAFILQLKRKTRLQISVSDEFCSQPTDIGRDIALETRPAVFTNA